MTSVHADPYWKWAEVTDYAHTGAGGMAGKKWVQILVELVMPNDISEQALALHTRLQSGLFGGHYKGFVPSPYRKPGTKYCTAWVARDGLAHLPVDIVHRFKLGLAINIPAASATSAFPFEGNEECLPSRMAHNPLKNERCVLAIIDDYVNHDHPTFKTALGTNRIKLIWDQAGNTSTAFHTPNYGYGRLLKDLRPWSSASHKLRMSHGTHVAGLAGGAVTPGFRMRRSSPVLFANAAQTDAASAAPLAVVMLPNSTVADTSGGALGVNVLDALTFLIDNMGVDTHLLVNLSFGTMAGAHDGSGILESAVQNLITRREGKLTVVIPSGNSFESQCHAQFSLKDKPTHTLLWRVLPDDKTCSFLELWLPQDANVSVTLHAPDGRQSLTLNSGGNNSVLLVQGVAFAGMWEDPPAAASAKKRIFIALAPTRCMNAAPCAPHGDWTVAIENQGNDSVELIHAWVERDNTSFGQPTRGRQSYLVDEKTVRTPSPPVTTAAGDLTGFGSLNSIGTFTDATVISGYNLKTRTVANYSGAGSARAGHVRAPSYAAPSEESLMLKGLPSIGNAANSVVRLGGTSVAAPYATRLIFNSIGVAPVAAKISSTAATVTFVPRAGIGLVGP